MRRHINKPGRTRFTKPIEPFTNATLVPMLAIESYIEYARGLDIKNLSINEIQAVYGRLLYFFDIRMTLCQFYPLLYRARITKSDNLSDLLYPPANKVATIGRCNDKQESLFYCSNSFVTSVLEIKPQVNDIVTVLQLEVHDTTNLRNFVPAVTLACDQLVEKLQSNFVKFGNKLIQKKLDYIDSFFSEIMLQDVGEFESYKYKASVALCKAYNKHLKSQVPGYIYPSKASRHFGVNFAVNTKWVDELPNPLLKAFRFRIIENTQDFNCKALLTEVATDIDSDGKFKFVDVSFFNYVSIMDKEYFEIYEQAFKLLHGDKMNTPFYRRVYPPPILPGPYKLVDDQLVTFDPFTNSIRRD